MNGDYTFGLMHANDGWMAYTAIIGAIIGLVCGIINLAMLFFDKSVSGGDFFEGFAGMCVAPFVGGVVIWMASCLLIVIYPFLILFGLIYIPRYFYCRKKGQS